MGSRKKSPKSTHADIDIENVPIFKGPIRRLSGARIIGEIEYQEWHDQVVKHIKNKEDEEQ